jgi:NhaA family Na+:H+ antiporter
MYSKLKEIVRYIRVEVLSGVILIIAALLAIYLKNSQLSSFYDQIIHSHLNFLVNQKTYDLSAHFIVNDFLMAVFFLVVGLEIKREILIGELSSFQNALLPAACALGGMIAPALVFYYFNFDNALNLSGWAIPTATDIAFSLGILALLGDRVPFSLKIFLTALAIIDDLLAVIVIAVFYTNTIKTDYLLFSSLVFLFLFLINKLNIKKLEYYLVPGLFLFYFVYKSGVHATIAGALLGTVIPLYGKSKQSKSPLKKLEHFLHPCVSFLILPVFAFFNSGVELSGIDWNSILSPIVLGCALGLFIGKQAGVMFVAVILKSLNIVKLPLNSNWLSFYGVSVLTGIGFTMSLFIGNLAYSDLTLLEQVKIGVIIGSILSAVFGLLLLVIQSSCKLSNVKS